MLAKAYPVVRDILDDLKNFSLSKEIRAAYNLHMKAVYEYESYKSEYFRQGQKEGAAREREKWESEFEALRPTPSAGARPRNAPNHEGKGFLVPGGGHRRAFSARYM